MSSASITVIHCVFEAEQVMNNITLSYFVKPTHDHFPVHWCFEKKGSPLQWSSGEQKCPAPNVSWSHDKLTPGSQYPVPQSIIFKCIAIVWHCHLKLEIPNRTRAMCLQTRVTFSSYTKLFIYAWNAARTVTERLLHETNRHVSRTFVSRDDTWPNLNAAISVS